MFIKKDVDTVVAALYDIHVLCYWTLKNKIGSAMSFTLVFQATGQRHKANLPLCASYQQCREELCMLWKTQEQFRVRKFNSSMKLGLKASQSKAT